MVLEVKKHVCSRGSSAGDLVEELIRTLHLQVDILEKKKDSDEQSRVHLVDSQENVIQNGIFAPTGVQLVGCL